MSSTVEAEADLRNLKEDGADIMSLKEDRADIRNLIILYSSGPNL